MSALARIPTQLFIPMRGCEFGEFMGLVHDIELFIPMRGCEPLVFSCFFPFVAVIYPHEGL